MDWKAFLEQVKTDPKNFAKAVIDNLNPPKYVVEALKGFEWMCHFCWKPRIDICNYCHRSVCEDHCSVAVGDKTELEWYFCIDCLKTHTKEEIATKVKAEDEEFWLEDQEAEKSCKGGLCATEVNRKFKVIITLFPPLIFTDNWPRKPSKDQVLEMLANDIRERKYDLNFHVAVEEVKEA